jgi:hypothetical protein
MKKVLTGLFLLICALPVSFGKGELDNYGVKKRSVGGTLTSNVADRVLADMAYDRVRQLVPFVRESSAATGVPPNILLAVLFEEATHRKPADIQTFGVAQLGVGELTAQGLPPDPSLLENDRLSVWVLARKLRRLQVRTGSLLTAVTLHNGYYDYGRAVTSRSRDPRLLALLNANSVVPSFFT